MYTLLAIKQLNIFLGYMSTGTSCKCLRLCWETDSMLVSNQCCNSAIYEVTGLKGERNIQQCYLVN